MYFFIKTLITALMIATISLIAKKSTSFAALIASLPLTSILAMVWMYQEDKKILPIADLSIEIFWLVIPSLAFFISMPTLLRRELNFYVALFISMAVTIAAYFLFFKLKNLFNL